LAYPPEYPAKYPPEYPSAYPAKYPPEYLLSCYPALPFALFIPLRYIA